MGMKAFLRSMFRGGTKDDAAATPEDARGVSGKEAADDDASPLPEASRDALLEIIKNESGGMNSMETVESETFGCDVCWPASADAAWNARASLAQSDLVDESHYHVMVMTCGKCSQSFLSVFTEMIDWQEGNDSQEWTSLPITAAEVALLTAQGEVSESLIESIGQGRRSLCHFFPNGSAASTCWSRGIRVGIHD
jgi:hypothetical protein